MATFLEGNPAESSGRFAIVVARFNADITEPLLDGCLHTLAQAGVDLDSIDVARVPGAFELPLTTDRFARSGRYAAVIALGAIIRGGTPHFDYVSQETCRGLMEVNLRHGVPIILGILTCDTLAQAQHRADPTALEGRSPLAPGRTKKSTPRSNKGSAAAAAALEMASLLARI